jgi:NADPH-dependent glutamate synthase beta subunit-like oxidoreductase/ferredoxin
MINLKIDNITLSLPEGTSVLEAAKSAGISIPSMCYLKGQSNYPSCMVCMVKDRKTGNLFASCGLDISEGMDIISNDESVRQSRKEALELLMSDHVGDCEAPCSLACPAKMDIPVMNRLLAEGKFKEALEVVRETIAIPYILGYICPAPCEKACRRKQVDNPVSICLLKRASAAEGNLIHVMKIAHKPVKKVAVIGTGPAGLAAAFYLIKDGFSCTLFDKNEQAGGALRYSIPEEDLPRHVLDAEINLLQSIGAVFKLNYTITEEIFTNEIQNEYGATILATGEVQGLGFFLKSVETGKTGVAVGVGTFETSLPGVFACGSILRSRKMAVHAAAQGREAARSAILYLQGISAEKSERKFNSRFEKLFPEEFDEYLKESVKENRYEPSDVIYGFTGEEIIKEAKRCLHCDCRKIDTCKLRNYSDEYKVDRRKYLIGQRNSMIKFDQHETIIYEPEKCIRCGLCIDITIKEKEPTGLAFFGRGFDVRMNVPFRQGMQTGLTHSANKCVEYCPTGALAFKKA